MYSEGWKKTDENTYCASVHHLSGGMLAAVIERKGDVWQITRKRGEDYDGTETYTSFEEAMIACYPDWPVYGTEAWKKNPSPYKQPGTFDKALDCTLSAVFNKWTGVIALTVAINLLFRCFGK